MVVVVVCRENERLESHEAQMQVADFFETHQGDIDGLRLVVLNALHELVVLNALRKTKIACSHEYNF